MICFLCTSLQSLCLVGLIPFVSNLLTNFVSLDVKVSFCCKWFSMLMKSFQCTCVTAICPPTPPVWSSVQEHIPASCLCYCFLNQHCTPPCFPRSSDRQVRLVYSGSVAPQLLGCKCVLSRPSIYLYRRKCLVEEAGHGSNTEAVLLVKMVVFPTVR